MKYWIEHGIRNVLCVSPNGYYPTMCTKNGTDCVLSKTKDSTSKLAQAIYVLGPTLQQ